MFSSELDSTGVALIVQPSLFGSSGDLGLADLGTAVERRPLSDGAWIDVRPGFVTGADHLFDALVAVSDALSHQSQTGAEKRAIILISDGYDSESQVKFGVV